MDEGDARDQSLGEEFHRYFALLGRRDTEKEVPPSRSITLLGSQDVREQYSIEDGVLIGRGEVQSTYSPASRPEILQDFQRIRTDGMDNEPAILAFARRWGGLGYSELQSERADSESEEFGLFPPTRDPVDWIIHHAVSIWITAETLGYVRSGDDLPAPEALMPPSPFVFAAKGGLNKWDYAKNKDIFFPSDTREALQYISKTVIDENVSGIHIEPKADFVSKKIESGLSFTSLIEVIWWHVMNLGGSSIIKKCPECGSVFPATRANQVYCPIPFYSSGTVSPCSSRMRMRAHRESNRSEGKP